MNTLQRRGHGLSCASRRSGGLMVALAACDVDAHGDRRPGVPGRRSDPRPAVAAGATAEFQRAYSGASGQPARRGVHHRVGGHVGRVPGGGTFTTRIAIDRRIRSRRPGQHHGRGVPLAAPGPPGRPGRPGRAHRCGAPPRARPWPGCTPSRVTPTWRWARASAAPSPSATLVDGGPPARAPDHHPAVRGAAGAVRPGPGQADAGNHLAAVGKGRALLNLGRFADAAAAVAGVPTTSSTSSSTRTTRGSSGTTSPRSRPTAGGPCRTARAATACRTGRRATRGSLDPAFRSAQCVRRRDPALLQPAVSADAATSVNNAANTVLADGSRPGSSRPRPRSTPAATGSAS
jgi:hypothetical protein